MKWHERTAETMMVGAFLMVAQGFIILLKSPFATFWHWAYVILQQIVLGAALGFVIAFLASLLGKHDRVPSVKKAPNKFLYPR